MWGNNIILCSMVVGGNNSKENEHGGNGLEANCHMMYTPQFNDKVQEYKLYVGRQADDTALV